MYANKANLQLVEAELLVAPTNRALLSEKAKLSVDISQGGYDLQVEVPIIMSENERSEYNNLCLTQRYRQAKLDMHRGQVFALILGQCTQLLQDKLIKDPSWLNVSSSYDPLELYKLI